MPTNYVVGRADETALAAIQHAVAQLKAQGVPVDEVEIPELDELPYINRLGGFVCAEAWFYHKDHIANHEAAYDPRVASRILRGKEQSAADYIELQNARMDWIARMEARLAPYDALILPTTPIVPPTLAELEDEEAYF